MGFRSATLQDRAHDGAHHRGGCLTFHPAHPHSSRHLSETLEDRITVAAKRCCGLQLDALSPKNNF